MSTASKCDRCGKYYDHSIPVRVDFRNWSSSGVLFLSYNEFIFGRSQSTEIDLCSECQEELADWWRKGKHK